MSENLCYTFPLVLFGPLAAFPRLSAPVFSRGKGVVQLWLDELCMAEVMCRGVFHLLPVATTLSTQGFADTRTENGLEIKGSATYHCCATRTARDTRK